MEEKVGVPQHEEPTPLFKDLGSVGQGGQGIKSRRMFTGDGNWKAHGSIRPWAQKRSLVLLSVKCPKF